MIALSTLVTVRCLVCRLWVLPYRSTSPAALARLMPWQQSTSPAQLAAVRCLTTANRQSVSRRGSQRLPFFWHRARLVCNPATYLCLAYMRLWACELDERSTGDQHMDKRRILAWALVRPQGWSCLYLTGSHVFEPSGTGETLIFPFIPPRGHATLLILSIQHRVIRQSKFGCLSRRTRRKSSTSTSIYHLRITSRLPYQRRRRGAAKW